MRLKHYSELAQLCHENGEGFAGFLRHEIVSLLRWPDDVLEQWIYDHAGNDSFLKDYGDVDLPRVAWEVAALSVDTLTVMPTGRSDGDAIECVAADPEHWVAVRGQGVHMGVKLCWDIHGTWKRWPIVLDQDLLSPGAHGLQLVEGRNRVGILRGRRRQGNLVADRHLVWIGRRRE